jgi:hypothetical protein
VNWQSRRSRNLAEQHPPGDRGGTKGARGSSAGRPAGRGQTGTRRRAARARVATRPAARDPRPRCASGRRQPTGSGDSRSGVPAGTRGRLGETPVEAHLARTAQARSAHSRSGMLRATQRAAPSLIGTTSPPNPHDGPARTASDEIDRRRRRRSRRGPAKEIWTQTNLPGPAADPRAATPIAGEARVAGHAAA